MDGLTVSELARRSGVPATTVRYYDGQGLLRARRSAAGYRLFDDVAVDRLAFIGTAESLGLPLPEIRGLLEPWQHGRCSDVQRELAPLIERRLAETRGRVRELDGLVDRLARAHAHLELIDRDGPCDPSCAFLGRTGPAPVSPPREHVVIACALGDADRAERVARWHDALAGVTGRVAIPGGVRLTFDRAAVDLGALAELADAESRCCAFLELSLHLGPPPRLDATAPADALVVVHELFGEPGA